ncbi:PhzF family phenazine biosynthesis protein [Novosphingobium colocasiae]
MRIFYPGGELPFAGHPTLGSCHAWLAAGGVPKAAGRVVQQCGIGLVTVKQDGDRLAFAAPPLVRSGPLSPEDRAEAIRLAGGWMRRRWWRRCTSPTARNGNFCASPAPQPCWRQSLPRRPRRAPTSALPAHARRAARPTGNCAPSSPTSSARSARTR